MITLRRLITNTFTGKDNKTIDVGRIIWMMGAVTFIGCTIAEIYITGKWDAIAFGTGFGAVLAAGGFALKMKEGTEPDPSNNETNHG